MDFILAYAAPIGFVLVYIIGFFLVWKFIVSAMHNIIQTWIVFSTFIFGLFLYVSMSLSAFAFLTISKGKEEEILKLFIIGLVCVFIIIIPSLYMAKLTKEVKTLKKKIEDIESNNIIIKPL